MKKPSIATSLTIHRILVGIGDNLFKLFFPVLIYNATGSIFLAALYIFTNFFGRLIADVVFKKMFYRNALIFITINVVLTLLVQVIFTLNVAFTPALVVTLALLCAVFTSSYHIPVNTLFAATKGENADKSLKTFEVAALAGKMVAPLIGGLFLNGNNFIIPLILCAILYISSLIVLYIHHKEINQIFRKIELEQPDTIYKVVKKQNGIYNFYYFILGFSDTATDSIWPLLLAVSNVGILGIGIVNTIQYAGQILAQYVASYLGNRKIWHVPAMVAMFIRISLLIAMPFMLNNITIYIYGFLVGLAIPIYSSPVFANYVNYSDENNMLLNNMASRDIALDSGRTTSSLIFVLGCPIVPALIASLVPFYLLIPMIGVFKKQHKNRTVLAPDPASKFVPKEE